MSYLENILEKLGWNDGFQIPVANEENQALEAQLAELALKKLKSHNALEIVNTKLKNLSEHFKFLGQEYEHNQKLITSQNQRLDSVKTELHTAKAEKSKLESTNKKILKDIKENETRNESKLKDLQKGVLLADQLKAEVEWDAEAVKAWEESLKTIEENADMLKKLQQDDLLKYNLLEAKRQHLQTQITEKKQKVSKLSSEAFNNECIVERTGKVIKQLSQERCSLTNRWSEAIKMLKQRDLDLVDVQNASTKIMEMMEQQKERLKEEETFLENEKKNNKVIEMELQSMNASTSRMRKDQSEIVQTILLLNSELFATKRQIASSAQRLEHERIKGKNLLKIIEDCENQIQKFDEDLMRLKEKVVAIEAQKMSSKQRLELIETTIEENKKSQDTALMDMEKVNTKIYRLETVLNDQKEIGKMMEIDIANATNNCKQLTKLIENENKEIDKLKEVVYNMEYRIDEIEKKLYKAEEDNKLESIESDERNKQIIELEKVLYDYKEVQHALQSQVDRLRDEMRRLNNTMDADKEVFNSLKSKCDNFLLVFERGLKQLKQVKKKMHDSQVEENLMKLHLKELENEKNKEQNEIITLEMLRVKLDGAMKERQSEIEQTSLILLAQKRCLEDDKGHLKTELSQHRLKISQVQKKYHLTLMLLGKNEDGEPLSVSHFKIRNAQEKFFLQQQGDELDRKIKAMEKEIVAMENTLKLLNLTNVQFKNSLALVKSDDKEVIEMKQLEEHLRSLKKDLKHQGIILATKEKELEILKKDTEGATMVCEERESKVREIEEQLEEVRRQEADKSERIKRTEINLKKTLKKLRKANLTKFERDLEIRQIKEANDRVLQQLIETCFRHNLGAILQQLLTEHQITVPKDRSSSESVPWSMPSSVSSRKTSSSSYDSAEYKVSTVCLTPELPQ